MNKASILVILLLGVISAQAPNPALKSCALNVSKNGRCGPTYQNTRCAGGPTTYCSKWSWCGGSALHKSTMQAGGLYNGRVCAAPIKKIVKPAAKVVAKKVVAKKAAAKKVGLKIAKKVVAHKAAAKKVVKKVIAHKAAAKKVVKKVLAHKKVAVKVAKKVVAHKAAAKKA